MITTQNYKKEKRRCLVGARVFKRVLIFRPWRFLRPVFRRWKLLAVVLTEASEPQEQLHLHRADKSRAGTRKVVGWTLFQKLLHLGACVYDGGRGNIKNPTDRTHREVRVVLQEKDQDPSTT